MKDPNLQDEYYIKLGGRANIPNPLEIGKNYKLVTQGTVTSFTESDLNDGRHVIYYKYVPVTMETIDDMGEAIKAKDTRSSSKLLRAKFWKYWQNLGIDMNFEDWYTGLMLNLIRSSDELADMYRPLSPEE